MTKQSQPTPSDLVAWLRDLAKQSQRLADCDGDLADTASVKAFTAAADLIEQQASALKAVEQLCDEYCDLPGFADIIRKYRTAIREAKEKQI